MKFGDNILVFSNSRRLVCPDYNIKTTTETAYYVFHVHPEDGHCQSPKHVFVPYVVSTRYLYHQIKLC